MRNANVIAVVVTFFLAVNITLMLGMWSAVPRGAMIICFSLNVPSVLWLSCYIIYKIITRK